MAKAFEEIPFCGTPVDQKFATNRGMIGALIAPGPAAALAGKLDLFGRLVGSWDVDLISHRSDKLLPKHAECEWHFGWVLGGRAIQDVWIAPKRALREGGDIGGEWGTMIRFYDKAMDAWRCPWHGPGRGVVRTFPPGRLTAKSCSKECSKMKDRCGGYFQESQTIHSTGAPWCRPTIGRPNS